MVSLRARAVPLFPDPAFGNCITSATAVVTSSEDDDVGMLVSKLRAVIRGVDGNYIDRCVKDDGYSPLGNNGGD